MKLALIGTFHGRISNTLPLLARVLGSTRIPNEIWLLCEDQTDTQTCVDALRELGRPDLALISVVMIPTPKKDGRYQVIPYSNKINWALDRTRADAVCYLDNGSMPHIDKYRVMAEGLEAHPEWGAVYVSQQRSGYLDETHWADEPIVNAHSRCNFTQVCHRVGPERWTLDMRWADPDLADAMFWESLHPRLGAFYPVGGGTVLDFHRMDSPKAAGV